MYAERHNTSKKIELKESFNNSGIMSVEAIEQINSKIKVKKKQLGLMWSILFTILFIGFYEMVYSAIQKIAKIQQCNHMFESDVPDAILLLISRFVGLVLWTIPAIYVYWAREYIISLKARSIQQSDDEDEEDEVDRYFAQTSDQISPRTTGMQTQSPLLIRLKDSDKSNDENQD